MPLSPTLAPPPSQHSHSTSYMHSTWSDACDEDNDCTTPFPPFNLHVVIYTPTMTPPWHNVECTATHVTMMAVPCHTIHHHPLLVYCDMHRNNGTPFATMVQVICNKYTHHHHCEDDKGMGGDYHNNKTTMRAQVMHNSTTVMMTTRVWVACNSTPTTITATMMRAQVVTTTVMAMTTRAWVTCNSMPTTTTMTITVVVEEAPISFSPFTLADCMLFSHFSFSDFIATAFLDLAEDLNIQI